MLETNTSVPKIPQTAISEQERAAFYTGVDKFVAGGEAVAYDDDLYRERDLPAELLERHSIPYSVRLVSQDPDPLRASRRRRNAVWLPRGLSRKK